MSAAHLGQEPGVTSRFQPARGALVSAPAERPRDLAAECRVIAALTHDESTRPELFSIGIVKESVQCQQECNRIAF
jgi:hypothetical protein